MSRPNLMSAVDNFSTTLSSSITNTTLTIPLSSVAGLGTVTSGIVLIDGSNASAEYVGFENVSGSSLTVTSGERGLSGTTAVSHLSGASVQLVDSAKYQNGIVTWATVGHNDDGTHKASQSITSWTIATPTITMANNVGILGKESGGTTRNIAKVNTSNQLEIGDTTLSSLIFTKFQASAYRNTSTQAITLNTLTKIQLNAILDDANSNFDTTTNFRYTAPVTGTYLVFGRVDIASTTRGFATIYKNGSEFKRGFDISSGSNVLVGAVVACRVPLIIGDYIELWGFSASTTTIGNGSSITFLDVQCISK